MKKSWNEVSLKEFQAITAILTSEAPEYEKMIKIISLLTGKSVEAIESMPFPVVTLLIKDVSFVFGEIPKTKPKDVYEIGGKKFIFQRNVGLMSLRSYIDAISMFDNLEANMHNILTTVLLPAERKKTFWGEKYVALPYGEVDVFEVAKHIHENISIVDTKAIADFFLKSSNYTMRTLILKIRWQIQKEIVKLFFRTLRNRSTYIRGYSALRELDKKLEELFLTYSR